MIELESVLLAEELRNSLISVTKLLKDGGKVENDGKIMIVTDKNGKEIKFDYLLETANGYVGGAILLPIGIDETVDKSDLERMNRNKFHEMSTHQWSGNLDKTAEVMGYVLTGKLKDCLHCARAKIKQKKMNKIEQGGNLKQGSRIAMDMTSSKTKSLEGKSTGGKRPKSWI